jgi:hypothetical protein
LEAARRTRRPRCTEYSNPGTDAAAAFAVHDPATTMTAGQAARNACDLKFNPRFNPVPQPRSSERGRDASDIASDTRRFGNTSGQPRAWASLSPTVCPRLREVQARAVQRDRRVPGAPTSAAASRHTRGGRQHSQNASDRSRASSGLSVLLPAAACQLRGSLTNSVLIGDRMPPSCPALTRTAHPSRVLQRAQQI